VETLRNVFETIIMARVSASAPDARALRLLSDSEGITMNRSRLISDARTQALRLVREGFSAPRMREDIPAPGMSVFATLKLGVYLLREGEFISDHEVKIATHVAKALTGGDITPGTLISEQHLLDLEREAFISLCAEPKTLERIAYTLKTGKPLRN
jgi:3-hydroxyacyl-CoA dehydrogenase